MARTLEVIKAEMKAKIRTYPELDAYLFPEDGGSQVSVFNLIIFTVAAALYTLEVMIDILQSTIQGIADSAPAGNAKWVQRQILNFQYGDVVILTDFVPGYDPVDESARIITRVSVKELGSGIVAIKVAKGVIPSLGPLTGPELSALTDYYYGTATTEGIGFAGVRASFVNLEPDRMRVEATVYFLGQYIEADVKADVIAAIDEFFATFQDVAFDGTVFMIKLVDAIQAVPGVSRVVLTDIKARMESVALGSATSIDVQGYYTTVAGYLISEDTASNTLTDTLTMQEESV
ncbi:MAG TPA: hypothetical protein VK589_04355 [Chryseolinea sp.]|nr:hypothetical protein [Chryseolinea sp.]